MLRNLFREGNMKRTVLFVLALAGLASAQGWQVLNVQGFTIEWATTGANELSVELTAPTTGWVGVGFDPDSIMLGANFILGYVASGTPTLRDDYGWQTFSHRDDTLLGGTNDISSPGGSESGGSTTITFTIPLDSGDQYDKPLDPGTSYTILLARGPNGADNFTTQHEFMTTASITIWGLALESGTWAGVKAAAGE
jgi:hypothetical protein